jgi:hypothetical protein
MDGQDLKQGDRFSHVRSASDGSPRTHQSGACKQILAAEIRSEGRKPMTYLDLIVTVDSYPTAQIYSSRISNCGHRFQIQRPSSILLPQSKLGDALPQPRRRRSPEKSALVTRCPIQRGNDTKTWYRR